MSRVLITGGAGFIGSHVARLLLDEGHDVFLYDSLVYYVYPLESQHVHHINSRLDPLEGKAQILRGSTEDSNYLRRSLRATKPDRIIHLAAMPLANLAVDHPEEALKSIMVGTMNLLQAAHDLGGVERFLYVSSSMVYGDFQRVPADEEHPLQPKEMYGALKQCGEIVTRSFSARYGLDHAIVRPSAVYGPTDNNRRVLAIFLENALAGEPLVVKGADSSLDFTYVSDAAAGIVTAALHPGGAGETFNITRGEGRSIREAAEIVARLVPGTEVRIDEADGTVPIRGALDISKARRLIGFEPRISLEEGLPMYLDYMRSIRDGSPRKPEAAEDLRP